MRPSWVAAGRPATALWFETRLPSLKTTNLPLIRSIGCTTCGPWPTTTVTTFASVSFFATAICDELGFCEFSSPQWSWTITASAPASRASRASRMIAFAPAFGSAAAYSLTDHGCGGAEAVGRVGVGDEADLHAVDVAGSSARLLRLLEANDPVCSTSLSSSASTVPSIPAWPPSSEWLEAVLAGVPAAAVDRGRQVGRAC